MNHHQQTLSSRSAKYSRISRITFDYFGSHIPGRILINHHCVSLILKLNPGIVSNAGYRDEG